MKKRTDSSNSVEINYVSRIQGMLKQLIDKEASEVTKRSGREVWPGRD